MKKLVFLTLLILGSLKGIAQTDSIFWFAAPAVIEAHGDGPVVLRLSNPDLAKPVTIVITMPAMGGADPINKTITLPPGGADKLDLTYLLTAAPTDTLNQLELYPKGSKIENKGIRLQSTSSQKFTAYYEILGSGDRPFQEVMPK